MARFSTGGMVMHLAYIEVVCREEKKKINKFVRYVRTSVRPSEN